MPIAARRGVVRGSFRHAAPPPRRPALTGRSARSDESLLRRTLAGRRRDARTGARARDPLQSGWRKTDVSSRAFQGRNAAARGAHYSARLRLRRGPVLHSAAHRTCLARCESLRSQTFSTNSRPPPSTGAGSREVPRCGVDSITPSKEASNERIRRANGDRREGEGRPTRRELESHSRATAAVGVRRRDSDRAHARADPPAGPHRAPRPASRVRNQVDPAGARSRVGAAVSRTAR